jgi:predicted NodU family carbamoyl transferase
LRGKHEWTVSTRVGRWKIIAHFDGLLVAAEEEGRFMRKKYDLEFPLHAIRYGLEVEGIAADAFDEKNYRGPDFP